MHCVSGQYGIEQCVRGKVLRTSANAFKQRLYDNQLVSSIVRPLHMDTTYLAFKKEAWGVGRAGAWGKAR